MGKHFNTFALKFSLGQVSVCYVFYRCVPAFSVKHVAHRNRRPSASVVLHSRALSSIKFVRFMAHCMGDFPLSVIMAPRQRFEGPTTDQKSASGVWYFAYGSNMKSSSMTNRGITPLARKVVQAPAHYVTFDIFGIPYSEPSYASIAEFPQHGTGAVKLYSESLKTLVPPACGVAYLLSPADHHRLLVTEGGGVVYELAELQVNVLGPGPTHQLETFSALTLRAKHPLRPNGAPSARYLVSVAGSSFHASRC